MGTIPFSRGSFQPRDWTHVSCISRWIFLPLSHHGITCQLCNSFSIKKTFPTLCSEHWLPIVSYWCFVLKVFIPSEVDLSCSLCVLWAKNSFPSKFKYQIPSPPVPQNVIVFRDRTLKRWLRLNDAILVGPKFPWRRDRLSTPVFLGFSDGSEGKEFTCKGDLASIPELGRSPGGRHGNQLQYSCLENPQGQRSLAGYSPWGCKELDMTERVSTAQHNLV